MARSVLVVSTFEAGFQPLASACAAGGLLAAAPDVEVSAWDSHLFPDDRPDGHFSLCLLACQQYEGLQRSMDVLPTLVRMADAVVVFGQYAQFNAQAFLNEGADWVLFDEPERCATQLAAIARGDNDVAGLPGGPATDCRKKGLPSGRLRHSPPARNLFPDIVLYPSNTGPEGLMGNIELSRGCHSHCTYCSVFGAYNGSISLMDGDSVFNDVLYLADLGIRHFVFVDAEFFSSRRAGVQMLERIVRAVGPVTFEMTTRVDHVLGYPEQMRRLTELGLTRVTTALEFPSDRILRILNKGVTVVDVEARIKASHNLGVQLVPTFIPFTPWVEYDELLRFEDWLVATGLASTTHPTSLQTKLLLFKGSPLLKSPHMADVPLAEKRFSYDWHHADERVENLWQDRRDQAEMVGAVRCCVKC